MTTLSSGTGGIVTSIGLFEVYENLIPTPADPHPHVRHPADERGPAAKPSPNQMPKSERHAPADADGRNHTPRPGALRMGNQTLVIPAEFRTLDGTGNNVAHPEWGSTEEPFLRLTTPAYGDGGIAPADPTAPRPAPSATRWRRRRNRCRTAGATPIFSGNGDSSSTMTST